MMTPNCIEAQDLKRLATLNAQSLPTSTNMMKKMMKELVLIMVSRVGMLGLVARDEKYDFETTSFDDELTFSRSANFKLTFLENFKKFSPQAFQHSKS